MIIKYKIKIQLNKIKLFIKSLKKDYYLMNS